MILNYESKTSIFHYSKSSLTLVTRLKVEINMVDPTCGFRDTLYPSVPLILDNVPALTFVRAQYVRMPNTYDSYVLG